MNLRTQRLFLRPIRIEDAPALFAARGDPEVMRYWDWPAQTNVAAVEDVFRAHIPELDDGGTKWWAVALSPDGPAIGECDLSEIDAHHARAELGFLFARAHWGMGYAHEAAQAAMAYGFDTLGLERLWARVHAGNDASVLYLTFATGLRPVPASIPRAIAWSFLYAGVAGLADWLLGVNYGLLRSKPPFPSVLDFMPAWPWYIPVLFALGFLSTLVYYAPWFVLDLVRGRRLFYPARARP